MKQNDVRKLAQPFWILTASLRDSKVLRWATLSSLLLLCSLGSGSVSAREWERFGTPNSQVFVEREVLGKMWDLELFQDAIDQCKSQRALASLGSDVQARWTLWWIETLTRQAVVERQLRESTLVEIDKIASDFVAEPTNERRKLWIEWQTIASRLAVSQGYLADYLAAPTRTEARETTLELARQILEQCESLQPRIEALLPIASKTSRDRETVAPSQEVQTLLNELLLLRVEALLVRSQCYPASNPDAIAYGAEMLKAVEQASVRIAADWFGRPRLDLFVSTALLQMEKVDEAESRLAKLSETTLDDELRWTVIAKRAEIQRRQGRLDEADATLSSLGSWEVAPQIALERLNWEIAKAQSTSSFDRALSLKDKIGLRFGSYWRQRAEALLVSRAAVSTGASMSKEVKTSLELIKTEASQLLSAERTAEAIERLQQAVEIARKNDLAAEAFEFQLRVGALWNKLGDKGKAADAFATAALEYPENSKASASHLMAAWLDTERLKANADLSSEELDSFQKRLNQQIQQWPLDENASKARLWLDRSFMASGKYAEAASMWTDAVALGGSADVNIEMAVLRTLLLAILAKQDVAPKPSVEQASKLDDLLAKLYSQSSDVERGRIASGMTALREMMRDDRWSSLDRGYLLFDTPSDRIVNSSTFEAKGAARFLQLAVGLVKRCRAKESVDTERLSECLESWQEQNGDPCWVLLPVAVSMFEIVSDGTRADRQAWGESIATMADACGKPSPGLSTSKQFSTALQILSASVQVWRETGNFDKPFEDLVKSNPKSPQVACAKALALRDHDPLAATKILQRVAAGVPAGSGWWFEARLRTAQCYRMEDSQGDARREQVKKVVDLVMATYPDADHRWKVRCQSLLAK